MEEVERSKLTDEVSGSNSQDNAGDGSHMLGLYAARKYTSLEPLTVYVGIDIGAAKGALDDDKGYKKLDEMSRRDEGRHVMQIGERLVDGTHGFTQAQYINSAYRANGWINKAEMANRDNRGGGGTIRVMENKVIQKGEEILMAYHDSYWSRWAPEGTRRRGRKRTILDQESGAVHKSNRTTDKGAASSAMHAACNAGEGGQEEVQGMSEQSPQAGVLAEDGGGCGRRVRDDAVARWMPLQGGKKRGRPPKNMTDTLGNTDIKRAKPKTRKRLRWTDTGREEFDRVQKTARHSVSLSDNCPSRSEWVQQFGRGEGGGVT